VAQWPKIGVVKTRNLARELQNARDVDVFKFGVQMFGDSYANDQSLRRAEDAAHSILDQCVAIDCKVISLLDDEYPLSLASIKDAPPFLFTLGDFTILSKSGAAVVGTRKCSELGRKWAFKIGEVLAENGYVTTSGLAIGIDASAHQGALNGNGPTVAVLAHGLDTIAPKTNAHIADDILASGGCLVSEHAPKVPPRPPEFVKRNRIQSGLSLCSIVVESGEKGGAMHQAKFTVEQGRKLFAVMPEKGRQFNYGGANLLMEKFGATPLRERSALLEFLGAASDERERNEPQPGIADTADQFDMGF
jgi:DNA processing protein